MLNIYGDREGSPLCILILLDHQRKVQLARALLGHCHTDHAGGIANHEADFLRGRSAGEQEEVALILTICIIGNNHKTAIFKGRNCLF